MTLEAPADTGPSEFDFEDGDEKAFFDHLEGKAPEAAAAPVEGVEGEGATGTPAEGAEPAGKAPEAPTDDPEIDLKIGTESRKFKSSELSELAARAEAVKAQESTLTESVARATTEAEKATTAVNRMLERAQARWAPYAEVNLLALATQLDAASMTALQKDMQDAYNDVQFFQSELGALQQQTQAAQAQAHTESAKAALTALSAKEGPYAIPDFGQPVYTQMVEFAVKSGMDQRAVLGLTDPAALKLIHMAMQYAAGQKATAAVIKPVTHTPTKVMTPAGGNSPSGGTDKKSAAMAKLRRSGSEDDATAAFMAAFGSDD